MTIQLNEPVIRALITKLNSNLPTYVAQVNATVDASVPYTILVPQRVLDYIPPTSDLTALPVIGISDGDISFHDDTGWGATGNYDLTVVLFDQSSDQRELAWKLRRGAQAIMRSLRNPNSFLSPEGWGVTSFRVRSGPTLGIEGTPKTWLSTVAVLFTVSTDQDT